MLILDFILFGVGVIWLLKLSLKTRKLLRSQRMLIESAKALHRQETEFQHKQLTWLLGVHEDQQLRQKVTEESRWN